MTPSIMSPTTADHGRPFNRTDTVQLPERLRRSERSASRSRGGLRKPGTTRPAPRVTWPKVRAAAANRTEVASMAPIIASGCDSRFGGPPLSLPVRTILP